jgi:hypothetical protein
MGDSNHWDAWAIMDQSVKLNIEPDLQEMMWALNRLVLWPKMMVANEIGESKEAPEDFMLWYDLADMVAPVSLAENTRQAHDRLAASEEELRRNSGLKGEGPSDEERLRAIGTKVLNPYLAMYGTKIWKEVDWDEADKHRGRGGRAGVDTTDDAPVGPGVGDPGSPDGGDSDTPKTETPQ